MLLFFFIVRKTATIDVMNKHTFIHQLQPGMKNVNSVFIVTAVGK